MKYFPPFFLFFFCFQNSFAATAEVPPQTALSSEEEAKMVLGLKLYLKNKGVLLLSLKEAGVKGSLDFENMTLFAVPPRRCIVHHTARLLRNVQELYDKHYKESGWAAPGYHFLINPDGTIVLTRPLCYQGAHTRGHNSNSFGLALNGCFTEKEAEEYPPTELTEKALEAYARLSAYLHFKFKFEREVSEAHTPRQCLPDEKVFKNSPGELLLVHWETLKEKIESYLKELEEEDENL